jgi:hypothetical protein
MGVSEEKGTLRILKKKKRQQLPKFDDTYESRCQEALQISSRINSRKGT